jgi:hypothetical protein
MRPTWRLRKFRRLTWGRMPKETCFVVAGWNDNWVTREPSLDQTYEDECEDERDRPDDESVRLDIVQFHLCASPGPRCGEREVVAHHSPDDERSTYTYSFVASSPSTNMHTSMTMPSERSPPVASQHAGLSLPCTPFVSLVSHARLSSC